MVITGSETIAMRMPMSSTSPRSPKALFAPGNLAVVAESSCVGPLPERAARRAARSVARDIAET